MNIYAQVENEKSHRQYTFIDSEFKEEDSTLDRVQIARQQVSDQLVEESVLARRVFAVINGDKK